MSDASAGEAHEDGEAPPRPFRTWKALYALVVLELALLIAGFGVFTRWFR